MLLMLVSKNLIKHQITDDKKLTQTAINAEIAKIETPLQRLNSILPELTLDNASIVSATTFGRFFDTPVLPWQQTVYLILITA